MKKVFIGLCLLASLVSAKDMTGKFALGGGASLDGPPALTFTLGLNTFLMLDAYTAWTQNDEAEWDLGGHLWLNLADYDNSNLYLGGGLNFGIDTYDNREGVDLSLEGGIRPTWYFNDHLAIYALTGVVIDLAQRLPEGQDGEITINLRSHLLGQGGVQFFF